MPRRRPAAPPSQPAAEPASAVAATAEAPLALPTSSDVTASQAGSVASSAVVPGSDAVTTAAVRRGQSGIVRPTAITKHGIRQFVETRDAIRLYLQNCVGTVNLGCSPELTRIAMRARNAEYNPKKFAAAIVRLREPKCAALIFASGKMVVTGARNEDDTRLAARRLAKMVQKLGHEVKFTEFRIQNIVGTGDVGYPVRLEGIADERDSESSYEPELFPGLIYRVTEPRATVLVFVSGKFVVTGAKKRSTLIRAAEIITEVMDRHRKTDAQAAPAAPAPAPATASVLAASSSSSSSAAGPRPRAAPRVRAAEATVDPAARRLVQRLNVESGAVGAGGAVAAAPTVRSVSRPGGSTARRRPTVPRRR